MSPLTQGLNYRSAGDMITRSIRRFSLVSPKPDSPKLGFRVRVRVGVSANRVSANREDTNSSVILLVMDPRCSLK